MRIRKLREIEKHILENPLRLYMTAWIMRKSHGDEFNLRIPREYASCGTAACIGGWACILYGQKKSKNTEREAKKILGLTRTQATRLFWPGQWPDRFKQGFSGDGTLKTAEVAVGRIEHFIKTKGRE